MKRYMALALALTMLLCCASALAETATGNIKPLTYHTYPLTEEPVTYTWIVSTKISDVNDTPVIQNFEELTGVHIDWIHVSEADAETRRNLMWASGDIPDIIGTGMFTSNDLLSYYQYGVLLPISDYIDTCMPNFKDLTSREGYTGVLDSITLSDGKIYSLPAVQADNHTQVTSQVSINVNWLDQLGLDMPTTTDELIDVLIAFRDNDMNGNGENDEVPFAYCYGQDWMNGQFNGWFGITQDIMISPEGVVTYSPYEDGWKEMVKFMNKLWEENLLDPELFTQDYATFNAKGMEGRYGVFQSYGKYITVPESAFGDYAYLAPLKSTTDISGSIRFRPDGGFIDLARALVSAEVENPELLMKYIDTYYDPYYGVQVSNGAIGVHLEFNADGDLVRSMDVPDEYATWEEWRTATIHHQLPCGITEVEMTALSGTSAEEVCYTEQTNFYRPYFINIVMPYNYMLLEESEEMAKYTTDITKYVNEQYAKWVSGESDVEADWDAYKAQLENLGVKEYVAAYQAYYDRIAEQFK